MKAQPKNSILKFGVLIAKLSGCGLLVMYLCGVTCAPPPPPSTVGALTVTTGFGAPGTGNCTGSGNITITPISLTGTTGDANSQTKPYTYSGPGSTDPNQCSCRQTVQFTNLRTGT